MKTLRKNRFSVIFGVITFSYRRFAHIFLFYIYIDIYYCCYFTRIPNCTITLSSMLVWIKHFFRADSRKTKKNKRENKKKLMAKQWIQKKNSQNAHKKSRSTHSYNKKVNGHVKVVRTQLCRLCFNAHLHENRSATLTIYFFCVASLFSVQPFFAFFSPPLVFSIIDWSCFSFFFYISVRSHSIAIFFVPV